MGKRRRTHRNDSNSLPFDKARDELLSHIINCGVLQAQSEHRKDWFDDTMEYLAERYPMLSKGNLTSLRELGERYCQPVIPRDPTTGAPT